MITDYFDSIRILNLEDRPDRRKEITREIEKLSLKLDSNGVQLYSAKRPVDAMGFPSIGARGCFMSHLNILKESMINDVNRLLIFEDDVDFYKDSIGEIEKAIDFLSKEDWDFVYFGHRLNLKKSDELLISYTDVIETAHAYAVNGKIIPRLVTFLEELLRREPGHPDGGPMHVDGAISTFRKNDPNILTYVMVEPVCFQRPSKTDIHIKKINESNPIIKLFFRVYRPLKRIVIKYKH